jgi:hypothetical protein
MDNRYRYVPHISTHTHPTSSAYSHHAVEEWCAGVPVHGRFTNSPIHHKLYQHCQLQAWYSPQLDRPNYNAAASSYH